jgi:hypothetical protein
MPIGAPLGRERQRRPDLRANGKVESGRRYANDCVGLVANHQVAADDFRIRAEPLAPPPVTDHDDPVMAGLLFASRK